MSDFKDGYTDITNQTYRGHQQTASSERNNGKTDELLRAKWHVSVREMAAEIGIGHSMVPWDRTFLIQENLCPMISVFADGRAQTSAKNVFSQLVEWYPVEGNDFFRSIVMGDKNGFMILISQEKIWKQCILVVFYHKRKPSMLLVTFKCSRNFLMHCMTYIQERKRSSCNTKTLGTQC